MKKRAVIILLICALIGAAIPVSAEGTQAYTVLASEEPVYVEHIEFNGLYGFFRDADTDGILDPSKCNYTYGEVTVGGFAVLCHVYMRTFDITDASRFSQTDISDLTQKTLKDIKDAVADKYLKCITKTYYLRLAYTADETTGEIASMTVKIFFACGEKTEDRAELRSTYIGPLAEELAALDTGERFIKLNGLILDGRFRYDVDLQSRSSVVGFVSSGIGVCEEYAGFTALMLDALGYENRIVTGTVNGVLHMWNVVKIEDRVYHLDILQNGPVDAEGRHISAGRDYLLVSEATVGRTHTVADIYKDLSSLALYDYVFDGYPESFEGSVERNGALYLPDVPAGTAVSGLCDLLSGGGFIRIFDNGEELGADAVVSTGCTADIYVNGKTLGVCTVCVDGDLFGDGAADEADLDEIIRIVMERDEENCAETVFFAADMNGDGAVTVTDAVALYDAVFVKEPEPEDTGEQGEEVIAP